MTFRPMLACDADLSKLRFPLLASPKLDGVRAIVQGGVVLSRSGKPIPNKFVQSTFGWLEHADGELIVGDPTSPSCYRDTVSGVMTAEGEPDVTFYIFDRVECLHETYMSRMDRLLEPDGDERFVILRQAWVHDMDSLLRLEQRLLDEGFEGLILRNPWHPYKMGRSTVKEGYLLKLKRFMDAEAVVIGFEERMHNGNEATLNELGYTKRSSHKENLVGRGDLGALICQTPEGVVFKIGTGFTDEDRAAIWGKQNELMGALAKYKYFPVGVKEAPRHPVFLGWRAKEDV